MFPVLGRKSNFDIRYYYRYPVYHRLEDIMLLIEPVTILAFFTAWAIFKLIFKLVLYPQFFTPLEHIPTPNVRYDPHFL